LTLRGGGGIDVYSLDYALSEWPDSYIYLTVGLDLLGKVTDWLSKEKGIERDRIKYPDPVEWRIGCKFIGTRLQFCGDKFGTCCLKRELSYSENYDMNLQKYRQYCNNLLVDLRLGKKTSCEKCAQLRYGLWPVEPRLEVVGFDTAFGEDICNFNCIYCGVKKGMDSKLYKQSLVGLLHKFAEKNSGEHMEIVLASGEICVSPYCDEVLGIISKNQWSADIFTNASVFNQKLADLMSLGFAQIQVSMDAGTQETFAAVKGMDCWNKVVANLKKYASGTKSPKQIVLKYILLPGINDNTADVDGFTELAHQLRASVFISSDVSKIDAPLHKDVLDVALRLIRLCKERKIEISLVAEFFNVSSYEQLIAAL
jgi:pyruvate-formate lyase-activating enzyme